MTGENRARRWMMSNLLLAVVICTGPADARTDSSPDQLSPTDTALLTTNRVLQAGLDRIARGSALWRAEVKSLRGTGRRALIVTADDLLANEAYRGAREVFDRSVLAEVIPVRRDSDVPVVLVVVNLALLQRVHDARFSVPREFEADLDRILVHEIYGHALPYLLAGNLSGRCPDPREGERASDACSIRRENAARTELGLGRRTDEGLSSLALAWGRSY